MERSLHSTRILEDSFTRGTPRSTAYSRGLPWRRGIRGWAASESTTAYPDIEESERILTMLSAHVPSVVAQVACEFKAIDEVQSVYISKDGPEVVINVFVDMPKYDAPLLDRLIRIEIEADELAYAKNLRIECRYHPLQLVTPGDLGLGKSEEFRVV